MARVIMVKQANESVVFLGRHYRHPMRHVYVWRCYVTPNGKQMRETTKPTTKQDGTFQNWLASASHPGAQGSLGKRDGIM